MDEQKDTFVCPYNKEVDCETLNCERCGWYPAVENARKEKLRDVKKFKVPFVGYCEVWAKSQEEAVEKADDVHQQFFAHYDYGDPICLTKEEDDELD